MSVGITGHARLIAQDESYAVYSYGGRNINVTGIEEKDDELSDSDIVIEKPCKYEFGRYGEENYIAHILLKHIYTENQSNGKLPERTGFVR